jgi:glycine/D-amino acid oxidase-like deaminating enzyme
MQETPNLPTPDFTFDPNAQGACLACVRPYRNGSYRLDTETDSNKFIVHNYGHGGAGITLSWGCAAKVRDMVQDYLVNSNAKEAAVLGAGVMGMTAATMLLDLGLKVTIYSDRRPADTTSFKAGGQWALSEVEFEGKEQELKEIVKTAYTIFKKSIDNGFGVSKRPNYTAKRSPNFDKVLQLVPGLIPEPVWLRRLPFEGHTKAGFEYHTMLIEPPIFLRRLERDLRACDVAFEYRQFSCRSEVLTSLAENIVVNCTGFGAMTLWSDPQMAPIKGELAMLPAQPSLQYLYGQNGYMFPRTDHLVIGGTFEIGVNDETTDPFVCKDLVDHVASQFGKAPFKPLPCIHVHHPDNARFVNPTMTGS